MSRFPMIMREYAKKAFNHYVGVFNDNLGEDIYGYAYDSDSEYDSELDCSDFLEEIDGLCYDTSIDYCQCHIEDCECDKDCIWDCDDIEQIAYIVSEINQNPNSIDFLRMHPTLIDRLSLADNPRAGLIWDYEDLEDREWRNPSLIKIIEEQIAKGVEPEWYYLSENEAACHILECNLDKVDWDMISKNKRAAYIIENHLEKINWDIASTNKGLIKILENNLDKVNWSNLSCNENAGRILEKNLDKVDLDRIYNNDNLIRIIEANLDKINPFYWVRHLCAMPLIKPDTMKDRHDDFIDRLSCSRSAADLHYKIRDVKFANEMIFTYDYKDIKDTMEPFTSMITGYFYRPVAVARWIESNDFETIGSEEYLVSAAKF